MEIYKSYHLWILPYIERLPHFLSSVIMHKVSLGGKVMLPLLLVFVKMPCSTLYLYADTNLFGFSSDVFNNLNKRAFFFLSVDDKNSIEYFMSAMF